MQGGFSSPNQYSSPSAQSPSVQAKRNQSLTPVSIKQLHEAKQPDQMTFTVDDKQVSQVKLVGMILSVDVQAANTNYTIDDGSAQIEVRIYTNDDNQLDLNSGCREDVYVKVVGNLRDIGGNRMVVAFQVHPIKSFNDITLHHLDVIHTHLKNVKGPLDAKGNLVVNSAPMMQTNQNYDAVEGGSNEDGMEAYQAAVLKVFAIHSKNKERGTSISEAMEKLPNYTPAQIREAVEFLSGEGHLYSTIDEDHYKCTSEE
eukprot:jgi/Bigna1/48084/estExt_Genewise1.C_220046